MSSDLRGYQPPPNDDIDPGQDSAPEEIFPVTGSDAPAIMRPTGLEQVETTLDDARRAYVKIHYERFAGVFARCDAAGGLRPSFNPVAFLFGELWFLYRKMYLEGLLVLVVSLVFSGYIRSRYLTGPEGSPDLVPWIQVAGMTLLGLLAKGLYWQATDRRIEKAMRRYPRSPHQALAWLDSVGGVNVPIVVVAFAVKMIFYGVLMASGAFLNTSIG